MRLDEIVTKLRPGDMVSIITQSGVYRGRLVEWTDQGVVLRTRKGIVYLNPLVAGIEALYIPNSKSKRRVVK